MLWSWDWAATASAGRDGIPLQHDKTHERNIRTEKIYIYIRNIRTVQVFIAFLLLLSNRNPDGDAGPWCHTYKNMQLTWELCDIPKCCEL